MPDPIIRVLVVDDSAVTRKVLREVIQSDPNMKVVAVASNGQEALQQIDAYQPDVVTLDVQMPIMDGLATLDEIFVRCPVPVIMVSALTKLGAKTTLDALERGAVDCVLKPDAKATSLPMFREELLKKIRSSAGIDVRRILAIRQERRSRRLWPTQTTPVVKPTLESGMEELAEVCIALGISTGGPSALTVLFENLRAPMPPIVIVQHMPLHFTGPLAWRLDSLSEISVKEAEADDVLKANQALIAPAGHHLSLRRSGKQVRVTIEDGPQVSGHRPSVDVMMLSAAKIFGPRCLGVIMTGMGRDGVDGCAAIRAAGGYVLGQNEATSDVYGMNKVAFQSGHVDRQFPLDDSATVIAAAVERLQNPVA
jgi:two-component system chemotaxis response regulator CheB